MRRGIWLIGPKRHFATANCRTAKGSFAFDVGCIGQRGIRGTENVESHRAQCQRSKRPIAAMVVDALRLTQ